MIQSTDTIKKDVLSGLKSNLRKHISKEKVEFLPRFFKTGKGEYGEGDMFIGVTVPNCRLVAKKYKNLSFSEIQKLLKSRIHEERLVALLILVENFRKGNKKDRLNIYNFYLAVIKYINNWDLVDLSSEYIVGKYILDNPNCATTFKGRTLKGTELFEYLARSENLWERRIAIISTFEFIRNNRFGETLKI